MFFLKLRDVQKKLSDYAQKEESETGNLQSASINNRHFHAPLKKTNEFLGHYRQTQSFNNFGKKKFKKNRVCNKGVEILVNKLTNFPLFKFHI